MEKKKKPVGALILASAIIWGAVIIGCSYKLKGTECYDAISLILFGGMISHFLLVWAPIGIYFGKNKGNKPEGNIKE